MDLSLTHKKNTVLGWNIVASATAGKGEKISRARISVNGAVQYDKAFNPPLSQWQQELAQQGQYPGENVSHLDVTDDNGNTASCDDAWSGIDG